MPITISTLVPERGTAFFVATFRDENGALVVPTSLVWSLRNSRGSIVNGRDGVVVAAPASVVTIVVSGDDLVYADGATRKLTIEAVYTSSLGAGKPLNEEITFPIANLVGVT